MVTIPEGILGLAVFWLVLSAVSQRANLSKLGILVGPFMLIWRTTKLNGIIGALTQNRTSKFWKKIGTGSSYIVLAMFFAFPFLLVYNLVKGYFNQASYLIPSSPIKYIDPSILVIVVPLFLAITINQVAKAIMASAEGVEVKSSGLFVVVFLFFGIIQSSQEALENLNRKSLIRILSFGILANLIFSLFFIQIAGSAQTMINPLFKSSQGAIVTAVEPNGPSANSLLVGDIITGLSQFQSNVLQSDHQITSKQDLIIQLRNIPAGSQFYVYLKNLGREVPVTGISPPVGVQIGSYLGIEVYDYHPPKSSLLSPLLPYYLDLFIQWSIALNLFFATFNLLALPYSDGQKISKHLLEAYDVEEDKRRRYLRYFTFVSAVLILLNLQATIW